MTHLDRRDATENAATDLAAYCGRFCNRARQEAASNTGERDPVVVDLVVAVRVAVLLNQLRKPVSAIL